MSSKFDFEAHLNSIEEALSYWRSVDDKPLYLISYFRPDVSDRLRSIMDRFDVKGIRVVHNDFEAHKAGYEPAARFAMDSWQKIIADREVGRFVVIDPNYDAVYQSVGVNKQLNDHFRKHDIPIALLSSRQVTRGREDQTIDDLLGRGDVIASYITRSNLKGSYAEFGTWFGASFFNNMSVFGQQLTGKFFAFDSFGGLPETNDAEKAYNIDNDWEEGRYFCNLASFLDNGRVCGVDIARINITPGFYSETIRGKDCRDFGMEHGSLSYAYIDCDLYESTKDVLDFIAPALEDGSVIYFDDWLLGRAARNAGEYHAAAEWLRDNPEFDLVPLHKSYWANQYFIFNRRWETPQAQSWLTKIPQPQPAPGLSFFARVRRSVAFRARRYAALLTGRA